MSRKKSINKISIFVRDNWICADCGGVFEDTPLTTALRANGESDLWNKVGNHMTVDHIIPVCQGGTNALTNLQAMCYTCNNMKGDGIRTNNSPRPSRMIGPRVVFPPLTKAQKRTKRRREQRQRARARLHSSV